MEKLLKNSDNNLILYNYRLIYDIIKKNERLGGLYGKIHFRRKRNWKNQVAS